MNAKAAKLGANASAYAPRRAARGSAGGTHSRRLAVRASRGPARMRCAVPERRSREGGAGTRIRATLRDLRVHRSAIATEAWKIAGNGSFPE